MVVTDGVGGEKALIEGSAEDSPAQRGKDEEDAVSYAVPFEVYSSPFPFESAPLASFLPSLGAALTGFQDRPTLNNFNAKKTEKGEIRGYQAEWNARSLDGLPGLRRARKDNGEWLLVGDVRAQTRRVLAQREGIVVGLLLGVLVGLVTGLFVAGSGDAAEMTEGLQWRIGA